MVREEYESRKLLIIGGIEMNKDYIEGIDLALSAIEDMVEDYAKHYEEMEVTRSEALQIIKALDTLEFSLDIQKNFPIGGL